MARLRKSYKYNLGEDAVYLNPEKLSVVERVCLRMGVSPDNLPSNIPVELTPELFEFLTALHESEHVTQHTFDPASEKWCLAKDLNNLTEYGRNIFAPAPYELMEEVDADLAVIEYLKEEGMDNVAKFRLDMREIRSMTLKVPALPEGSLLNSDAYTHDLSTILGHYVETGDVIDPSRYIHEKSLLVEKIIIELGMPTYWFGNLQYKCEEKATREPELSEISAVYNEIYMRPQNIRFALENLLERGKLDGLQKFEAENFIAAAKRMGYEAEPLATQEYKAQVETTLKALYGISEPGQDSDLSVDNKPPISSL